MIRLVPICFAVVDGWVASAVDHKPKRTGQLRRLDDIEAAGSATVLVDHYDEDWSRLWWIRIRGRAEVHRGHDEVAVAVLAALGNQVHAVSPTPARWCRVPDRHRRHPVVASAGQGVTENHDRGTGTGRRRDMSGTTSVTPERHDPVTSLTPARTTAERHRLAA